MVGDLRTGRGFPTCFRNSASLKSAQAYEQRSSQRRPVQSDDEIRQRTTRMNVNLLNTLRGPASHASDDAPRADYLAPFGRSNMRPGSRISRGSESAAPSGSEPACDRVGRETLRRIRPLHRRFQVPLPRSEWEQTAYSEECITRRKKIQTFQRHRFSDVSVDLIPP